MYIRGKGVQVYGVRHPGYDSDQLKQIIKYKNAKQQTYWIAKYFQIALYHSVGRRRQDSSWLISRGVSYMVPTKK